MNREVEDGMGFAGLVPTRAENEQERRNKREHDRIWNAAIEAVAVHFEKEHRHMDNIHKIRRLKK